MNGWRKKFSKRLSAYSLVAGATVVGVQGVKAGQLIYDNGGAGWFDARESFGGTTGGYDMILFKLDGTVLVDDPQIDPTLPNSPSIELMGESYNGVYHWGDGKTRDSAFARCSNAGIVGDYSTTAPEADKLAAGVTVGPSSTFVTGDVGMYGYGWYTVQGRFGGRGYLGFYMDNPTGRHYGWADISIPSNRNEFTLHSFAVQTIPGMAVTTGSTWSFSMDFDNDGDVDADDVDVLRANLGDPDFDLNSDGVGDAGDIEFMVRYYLEITGGRVGTEVGDVNLDGLVSAPDLAIMRAKYGLSGQGYADGNLNANDVINSTDLAILANNYGFVAPTGSPIPEPATLSLLALGAIGLTVKRQRDGG